MSSCGNEFCSRYPAVQASAEESSIQTPIQPAVVGCSNKQQTSTDALVGRNHLCVGISFLQSALVFIGAGLPVQEAALLYRTTSLPGSLLLRHASTPLLGAITIIGARRAQVRDILRLRVLRADSGNADIASFASLGERVVSRVKVLAFLEGFSYLRVSRVVLPTFSLFCSKSFLLGTFPYRRKIFCSSSDIF